MHFAETMDPLGRNENDEHILEDVIRGDDVATQFLNESGEGDESLNRGDGGPDVWEQAVLGDSDEGEADEAEAGGSGATLINTNSGEVHIYIYIN